MQKSNFNWRLDITFFSQKMHLWRNQCVKRTETTTSPPALQGYITACETKLQTGRTAFVNMPMRQGNREINFVFLLLFCLVSVSEVTATWRFIVSRQSERHQIDELMLLGNVCIRPCQLVRLENHHRIWTLSWSLRAQLVASLQCSDLEN